MAGIINVMNVVQNSTLQEQRVESVSGSYRGWYGVWRLGVSWFIRRY